MTSVLNRLLQLSGNKYFALLLICLGLSCSSKQYVTGQDILKPESNTQLGKSEINKSETNVAEQLNNDSNDLIYPKVKKSIYKVVFILPLMLNNDDQLEFQLKGLSRSALEFYMGALISLQKKSVLIKSHFDVYVLDCEYKTTTIATDIIPELKKIKPDLIMGPFLADQLKELSQFCLENKINLISPLVNSDTCLNVNPYFLSLRPSEKTHFEYIGKLLNSNFRNYNISIITETIQEKERYTKLISSLIDTSQFGKIQSYHANESNWRSPNFMKNRIDGKNIFIIFNKSSEVVINSLLTNLIGIQNKEETALIAPYSWLYQNTIDLGFLQNLNTHFITDNYFNYNDSVNFDFISRYRNKYNSEPSLLACLGYSYIDYFISQMLDKGIYFQREWLNDSPVFDSTVSVKMVRFPGQLGFQNFHMTILHFENSEIKQLNLR